MNAKTIIASISLAALPAVGTDLEGGTFDGLTTTKEGTHCAVVLLPGTAEELTWEAAKAWAAEQGGELPTRTVASLLFANVQPALSPEWHWTADEYDAFGAWYFHSDGHTNAYRKSALGGALSVRLIPIID